MTPTIEITQDSVEKIQGALRRNRCGVLIQGSLTGASTVTIYPPKGEPVSATHMDWRQALLEAFLLVKIPKQGWWSRLWS
jgi:hypothetical protein